MTEVRRLLSSSSCWGTWVTRHSALWASEQVDSLHKPKKVRKILQPSEAKHQSDSVKDGSLRQQTPDQALDPGPSSRPGTKQQTVDPEPGSKTIDPGPGSRWWSLDQSAYPEPHQVVDPGLGSGPSPMIMQWDDTPEPWPNVLGTSSS